jgi:hypothetical protein
VPPHACACPCPCCPSLCLQEYDLSHNINSFSVGPAFPAAQYPLAGVSKTMNMTEDAHDESNLLVDFVGGHGSGMYQYYLKVRQYDFVAADNRNK